MRAAARRLLRQVGRRGAILTLKGVMASLYGYSQLVDPPPPTGIRLLLKLMPQECWGLAWVLAGVVALWCALLAQGRDWAGFAAVYLMATVWAGANMVSWLLWNNPRGWVAGALFMAYGGVAAIAAEWPEPARGADERRRP